MKFDRSKSNIFLNWWWTIDRLTMGAIFLLIAIGFVLLMAASPTVAERIKVPSFHFVQKQLIFYLLGAIIIYAFSVMDIVTLRMVNALCFFVAMVLLVMVQFWGFETKGAKRWIYLGGFSLQPSEVLRPFYAVICAWFLSKGKIQNNYRGELICIIITAIIALFLALEPDFSMILFFGVILAAQLFIAGLPILYILISGVLGAVAVIAGYFAMPHVRNRIDSFLDPSKGESYQSRKSLEAFYNGGFFGTGPGEGQVKEIIPDAHTDFIFPVAGEELGVLVCLFIVFLFGFITLRSLFKMYSEKDLFAILAVSGLMVFFATMAVVNMGVAVGLLPNTGVTLPFISYGGSSMISTCAAMGMVLAFTKKRFGNN
jgi:cell division protein FtsW